MLLHEVPLVPSSVKIFVITFLSNYFTFTKLKWNEKHSLISISVIVYPHIIIHIQKLAKHKAHDNYIKSCHILLY